MLDFREVVGHDIASKTSQTPACCPVFPLFLLAAAFGKKSIFFQRRDQIITERVLLTLFDFKPVLGHKICSVRIKWEKL